MNTPCYLTVDVEEYYNILDVPGEIPFEQWKDQKRLLPGNLERLLELFDRHGVKVTMFVLGYFAEQYPELIRRCHDAGHEIASHGYAHVLAYKVGREAFAEDIRRGKAVLENIISEPVLGFRAAGFSTTDDSRWTFDEVRKAGYLYDASVFPSSRGHGGMKSSGLHPYRIQTSAGELLEIPQSMIRIGWKRVCLFGGGYLRLAPLPLIVWGTRRLQKNHTPFVLYVHPREIDPTHPRLAMNMFRRFKSYVNLKSTYPKLDYICGHFPIVQMRSLLAAEAQYPQA